MCCTDCVLYFILSVAPNMCLANLYLVFTDKIKLKIACQCERELLPTQGDAFFFGRAS
jgi:hypothetical protein